MKKEKFTKVYKEYSALVFKVIMHRVGNYSIAEEICQQVFTVYYERIDYIEESFSKAWLMCAARNASIDYLRKCNTRNSKFASEYQGRFDIVMEDNTERIVDSMVQVQLSFKILEDLREKNVQWYQVIEALCVQNMEQEEAAQYLQISLQVLRARLYRARKYIRQKYIKEFQE